MKKIQGVPFPRCPLWRFDAPRSPPTSPEAGAARAAPPSLADVATYSADTCF